MSKEHIEIISCPECGEIQEGTVKHTWPWWTYLHQCNKCDYWIMESEWDVVERCAKEKQP
jgi:hypothetical protein